MNGYEGATKHYDLMIYRQSSYCTVFVLHFIIEIIDRIKFAAKLDWLRQRKTMLIKVSVHAYDLYSGCNAQRDSVIAKIIVHGSALSFHRL